MNTATAYARLNITVPKDIADYMRRHAPNISKYVSDTIGERIAKERREKAFKEIVAGPPSFTDVSDSVEYVRNVRAGDEDRAKRLGL